MADVISYVQGPRSSFLKLSLLRQRRPLREPGDNARSSLFWGFLYMCMLWNGKGIAHSLLPKSTVDTWDSFPSSDWGNREPLMETTQPSELGWAESYKHTPWANDKVPTPWVTGITVPTFQKKALRLNEVLSNLPKVTQTVGAKDLNSVC